MSLEKKSDSPDLDAMRMGVEYRFAVRVRGQVYTMRPLSCFEMILADQHANDRLEELKVQHRQPMTAALFRAQEQLSLASSSDVGKQDSPVHITIMERMTPDELDFMHKQWLAGCRRCDPSLELMTKMDLEILISEVKKSPDVAMELTRRSFLELVSISHLLLTTIEG